MQRYQKECSEAAREKYKLIWSKLALISHLNNFKDRQDGGQLCRAGDNGWDPSDFQDTLRISKAISDQYVLYCYTYTCSENQTAVLNAAGNSNPPKRRRQEDTASLQNILQQKEIVRVEAETVKLITEQQKLQLEKEKIKLEMELLKQKLNHSTETFEEPSFFVL